MAVLVQIVSTVTRVTAWQDLLEIIVKLVRRLKSQFNCDENVRNPQLENGFTYHSVFDVR